MKYGALPAKDSEEIPWNKLFEYIYNMSLSHKKKGKNEHLNIKAITMLDSVTGCSKITEYNGKRAISIANLVETKSLTTYPRPIEIMYAQGSEDIGH